MLNPLSAPNLLKANLPRSNPLKQALKSPPKNQTTTTPLLAVALLGLLLTVSTSNQTLKQAGSAIALMAGGATAANLKKKDPNLAIEQLQANHKRREDSLQTALDLAMAESETFSEQLAQINEALVSWESEKILTTNQIKTLEWQQHQLLCELYEIAIAEKTLHDQTTLSQAADQTRITELEKALEAKTNMATQMLTELETEATETFNQFNAKINAQNQLIQALRQRIETQQIKPVRKVNDIPTNKQVDKQIERHFSSNGSTPSTSFPNNPLQNIRDNRNFGRQKMNRAS